MSQSTYFDDKETQTPRAREQSLWTRMVQQIVSAKTNSAYYASSLKDIGTIPQLSEFSTLPLVRKSDLIELQQQTSPLGGISSEHANLKRLFRSPGPIYDPQGSADDYWRCGRAFYAAGFRQGDVVLNTLSYHLTPGGFILDAGARACGSVVIPAGPGQTDTQLEIIKELAPSGYCGTPSFLKILMDKGDVSSITKALVTGEYFSPAMRQQFAEAGISVGQAYASADVGLIAYESQSEEGLIIAEDLYVEIVKPGTNELVPVGEVGEVVVTNFCPDYPLIRFATGDLSAMLETLSPCGRTNQRLKGWMGRADQTTKVKGMFVHPSQVAKIVSSYPVISNAKLVVTTENLMDKITFFAEVDVVESFDQIAATQLEQTINHIIKLKAEIRIVSNGDLVNDGKVIDDQRTL